MYQCLLEAKIYRLGADMIRMCMRTVMCMVYADSASINQLPCYDYADSASINRAVICV
jgi:hypothetical protein